MHSREYEEMVKMAYDEICGFEKEALWEPGNLNPVQEHLVEKGLSKKMGSAAASAYRKFDARVTKNQNTIDTLSRARRTMGTRFGDKAQGLLSKLERENDGLKRKMESVNQVALAARAQNWKH